MTKFECVVNELRRTAITNPLRKNADTAYYNADGSPCCIAGHALERLGFHSFDLAGDNFTTMEFLPWESWGFEAPTVAQVNWCRAMQHYADRRMVWIAALAAAEFALI